MAPSSQILRIPRTDTGKDGDYILGEVTTSGSKSTSIKFVATEGEEPYVLKRKFFLYSIPFADEGGVPSEAPSQLPALFVPSARPYNAFHAFFGLG